MLNLRGHKKCLRVFDHMVTFLGNQTPTAYQQLNGNVPQKLKWKKGYKKIF